MVEVEVVGVIALHALDRCGGHHGVHQRILAVALPHSGPAGVTSEVHGGGEGPGNHRGPGLVGGDFTDSGGIVAVEGRCDVDALGEEGRPVYVCRAVNLVEAVDAGYSDFLHRLLLDAGDYLPVFLPVGAGASWNVQDRAYLVFADDIVQHFLAELLGLPVGDHVDGQLGHLADFLLEGHLFKKPVDSGLDFRVLRDGGPAGERGGT